MVRKVPKTFLLSEKLSQKVEEFSQKRGLTQSEVIRIALFEFFEKYKEEEVGK